MSAHAVLGASSASRWMACPGSIRMIEKAPKAETSQFAAEGTAAHKLAELCLSFGVSASHFIYSEIEASGFTYTVDEEMAEAVQVYLDLVRQLMIQSEMEVRACKELKDDTKPYAFEMRFDLSWVHPNMFGTNDFCALLPQSKVLTVVDYKHGKGVAVDVEGNKQLMYYALGALKGVHFDLVDEVELIIVQPRAFHASGRVRKARYSAKWLRDEFSKQLKEAAVATEAPDAPIEAGSHCRFCPAKGICPAQHNQVTTITGAKFKDVYHLPQVTELTPLQIQKILESKSIIEEWLLAVQVAATNLATAGHEIPGHKLVRSNKHRTFRDKEAAKATLSEQFGADVLKTDLVGLGELEKTLKKKLGTKEAVDNVLNPLVYKPEGDIVLAPKTDKREEIKVGSLFSAVSS